MVAASLSLLLSGVGLAINATITHYPGNNHCPPAVGVCFIIILLIYAGSWLQFGLKSAWTKRIQTFIFFFLVITVLLIATNAIQFTPFKPIDPALMAINDALGINLLDIIHWTNTHPCIKSMLEATYKSLTYQVAYLPVVLIALGRLEVVREYLFLMLVTAIMGYCFYYFFPTTAPASMLNSSLFNEMQHATGLKFYQIHHYIKPTTFEGGMIALPSFHVIWAWLCVYLIRAWPIACTLLAIINTIMVLSCVLLGWHYPIDLLGSVIILLLGHAVCSYIKKSTAEHHEKERYLTAFYI